MIKCEVLLFLFYESLAISIFLFIYLVTGAADNGWEHGPGGIVSGEASLHQAGAVVAHKGGSLIVVTHGGFWNSGE